jgi:hypothetical protein
MSVLTAADRPRLTGRELRTSASRTMTRLLLVPVLHVLLSSPAYACKPLPWAFGYGANSSAEYARNLMKHATGIVLANVVSAERVEHAHGASSTADVTVIERFKGPPDIRQIHSVGFGTCGARTYTEGEQRLFVLLSHPNDTRLYEVLAWESPRFPEKELLIDLRKLKTPNDSMQPAPKSGAAGPRG